MTDMNDTKDGEKKDEPMNPAAEKPPFTSAAELAGMKEALDARHKEGLSYTPGLRSIPDSIVPGFDHAHVYGPQQSPVDPVAAGLDTNFQPISRAENRVITLTGAAAGGPRPLIADERPVDGRMVKAPLDEDSARVAGPAGSGMHTPVDPE